MLGAQKIADFRRKMRARTTAEAHSQDSPKPKIRTEQDGGNDQADDKSGSIGAFAREGDRDEIRDKNDHWGRSEAGGPSFFAGVKPVQPQDSLRKDSVLKQDSEAMPEEGGHQAGISGPPSLTSTSGSAAHHRCCPAFLPEPRLPRQLDTSFPAFVVVCNHQHAIDLLVILEVWPHIRHMAPLSKLELLFAGLNFENLNPFF